jgi:hypothetical protein
MDGAAARVKTTKLTICAVLAAVDVAEFLMASPLA